MIKDLYGGLFVCYTTRMYPNQSDQHQNMPDPLEFKPGEKIQTASNIQSETKIKSKVRLWRYTLPMIINLILFGIIQAAISNACSKLAESVQGECGAAWIGFFVILPLEVLVFVICLIIMFIGFYRWAK